MLRFQDEGSAGQFRTGRMPGYAVEIEPEQTVTLDVKKPKLSWRVRQWFKNLRDGSFLIPAYARVARSVLGLAVGYGELTGVVIHDDLSLTDYGLLGRRVVTDAGVAYLAADMAGGSSDINLFKFHAFGTGTTAEAAGQTALVTELTTEYATDNTRPTGSQSSTLGVYTTVGTLSPDATVTITEHGLMSQAANSGGTMWDRTKFTGIALTGSADSLQATYAGTFPSGG